MSEFVDGFDEGSAGEQLCVRLSAIELFPQAGEADDSAAAADDGLSEDEVEVRCEDIGIDDTEGAEARALAIDHGVEDRAGAILIAAGVEPIRIEADRFAAVDVGMEACFQPRD